MPPTERRPGSSRPGPPHARKPSKEQIAGAYGRNVPDLVGPGLDVLFCGINPSLYSAAVGHHFARPGNRFWPALHLGGFTPRLLSPSEEDQLLEGGCGITNVVDRATASADELAPEELVAGGRILTEKVRRLRPAFLAVLGVSAYRTAFGRKRATVGRQEESIAATRIWVLPNPSGLNAHYRVSALGALFGELRSALEDRRPSDPRGFGH